MKILSNLTNIDIKQKLVKILGDNQFFQIVDSIPDDANLMNFVILEDTQQAKFSPLYSYILFTDDKIENLSSNIEVISKKRPLVPFLNWLKNHQEADKYLHIDISKVNHMKVVPCDIFVELSERHFVHFLRAGDTDFKERLRALKSKGVLYIFIKQHDFYQHSDIFLANYFDVERFKSNPEEEFQNCVSFVFDTAKDLGIRESTLSHFKEILNTFESYAHSDKEMNELFTKFKSFKGTFLFNHSLIVSLLGLHCLKELSWADAQVRENFCLAAIIHDLGFSDPKSALIESLSKKDLEQVKREVREDVESHDLGVLQICLKSKALNPNMISIIKEHHSCFDYSSIRLNRSLSPTSALFTLVHSFATELIKKSFRYEKLSSLPSQLIARYAGDGFRQVEDVFKKQIHRLIESNS